MKNLEGIIAVAQKFGCCYLINEPLCRHTTFKVGGACAVMIYINSESSLCAVLKYCCENGIRMLILGNGSNILCSDRGFDGAVIVVGRDFQGIKLLDGERIEAQSGCTLMQLCTFALQNSLTGLEFAYGIPGTVGGGVYMNAGAYDGEISKVIESAQAVDYSGRLIGFDSDKMELGYRSSVFQDIDCVITKAVFALKKGERESIRARMEELMSLRKSRQPLDMPSAGSTFKRPAGSFAGKLIDDCGLRGYTVGGAQVSQKHCGFVVNRGGATFDDIMTIIRNIQNIVYEKTGYSLECEIRIVE